MVICYCSDDRYAQVTGVSLFSLLENNKDAENIAVYIIDDAISEQNKEKLLSMVKRYDREIFFVGMPDIEKVFGECQARYKGTLVIYVKLILYRLLPESVDRAIFLDSDTLVLRSLSDVYSINMDGIYVAAVNHTAKLNLFASSGLPFNEYLPDSFINGGFYLQNLRMLREPDIEQSIIDTVQLRKNKSFFNDEAIIEYIFRDRIIRLSPIYNSFESFTRGIYRKTIYDCAKKHIKDIAPFEEWREAFYHPVVVHFPVVDVFRPFVLGLCPHPYKKEYHKYRLRSPWRDTKLLTGKTPGWKRLLILLLYKALPYLAYLIRLKKYYYHK